MSFLRCHGPAILLISACLLSPCLQAEVQVVPGKTTPIVSPNAHSCDQTPDASGPFLLRFAECTASKQNHSLQLRAEVCCTGFDENVTSDGKLFYDFEVENLLGGRPNILTTKAAFTVKLDGYLISAGVPQIRSSLKLYAKVIDRQTNEDVSQRTAISEKNADVIISGSATLNDLFDFAKKIIGGKVSEVTAPTGATVVRVSDPPIPVTISVPLTAGGHYRLEIDAQCSARLIARTEGVAFCDFSESADGQIVVSPIDITVAEQELDAVDLINIITSPLLMDDDANNDKK